MSGRFRFSHPQLRVGTSSWSARGWVGPFYPPGAKPAEFIGLYAQQFDTVEVDSTFYGAPKRSTVEAWRDQTPQGFVFSAKAPRIITHDKFLVDCHQDMRAFLDTMALLGEKLGPVLLQFPYYAKRTNVTEAIFRERLGAFLPLLVEAPCPLAVEVRNKAWIKAPLLDLLREHQVALALIDHPWMDPPGELFKSKDILTGPFAYLRWLGNRHGIEKITTTFHETVTDRRADLGRWIPHIKSLLDLKVDVYGYANNHYGGHAPDTVELLHEYLE